LKPLEVFRLAATVELLAYGHDQGGWLVAADLADGTEEHAQPYQLLEMRGRKGGAR
jgi:hypothetical protein